jgi:CO/xanthine dehydrogenase Mo-binding subunit
VRSTVPAGRISHIDVGAAQAAPEIVGVITHENSPKLERGPASLLGPPPPPPLQDDRILYHGQYVAVVIAETPREAAAAARLVEVDYDPGDAVLNLDDPRGELQTNPWGADVQRGDVDAALASAEVMHEATYTTAENTNNPLGPFATVAAWDGDTVTVHDATQWTANLQTFLAATFGIPPAAVRVHAGYLGGAFGAGLLVWPHVTLTALAARSVGRPVKLVLTRPQMFTGIGHRPNTVQTLRLGARCDGEVVAIDHGSTVSAAIEDENFQRVTGITANAYACPDVSPRDRRRRLNIPPAGWMRAPSEAPGNFALESALDELSYTLGMDPLELRLRNYAEVQPQSVSPGRARRCGSATRSARSGSAGRSGIPRWPRCATVTGRSATEWPASATTGGRSGARPEQA